MIEMIYYFISDFEVEIHISIRKWMVQKKQLNR